MAITPHVLSEEEFKSELRRHLVSVECINEKIDNYVYADIKGVPTIGIGYALVLKIKDPKTKKLVWTVRPNLDSQMAAIGKSVSDDDTVSGDDKDILEDIAKALNDGDINKATELADSSFSFEPMTDDEAKNLLGYVVETEYATLLKSRIGTTLYNTLANSKELIALLSITYQNPSAIKQPLIDALTDGTRTEVWYQIRYEMNTSNAGWMANRRYKEANEFGLYNGATTDINTDEAKEIIQMYTEHKTEILEYEFKYSPTSSINNEIQPAKTFLIANFGQGVDINGEVLVGQGLKTASYEQITPSDDIIMTIGNKNNLIFGEGGDDSIITGDGNDVVYGGKGNDFISGGKGNDILNGGEGKDTYYYRAGDGNDKIIDTGENTIIIEDANGNKRTITNVYKTGTDVWTTADGKVDVTHHSPYKLVLEDGSTIELGEDISSFGINLLDTPTTPTTTNTILGNADANNIDDTTANDRIETGSGDDTIMAIRGGDDEILGGDGRDAISAGYGNDVIEGGSDSDILFGGGGSDQVFGENQGEMENLISQGETAQSINEKGDLVSGNDGNDMVFGTNKKDALFGGEGNKRQAKGYRRRAIGNNILKLAA